MESVEPDEVRLAVLEDLGHRVRETDGVAGSWHRGLSSGSRKQVSSSPASRAGGHLSEGPTAQVPALTCLAPSHSGIFIPSCDEDGYYRKMQCDQSSGDCWCVDQLGLELTGTRTHGSPDCGMGWAARGPLGARAWGALVIGCQVGAYQKLPHPLLAWSPHR